MSEVWVVLGVGLMLLGCKDRGPQTKQERADDAVSRVAAIEPELAKVRRLDFKTTVPASYQTATEFRAHVHRTVEKDKKVRDTTDALIALGLLPHAADLGRAVEDAYATQAAAYYDPDAKQFFFVMVPENKDVLDVVSAHELTHALQDQHFGLAHYMEGGDSSDARIARKFVVEGDAMLSSIAYAVFKKTHLSELTPQQVTAMREKLEQIAALDPPAMAAMLKAQASASSHMDPEIQKSLDAMDSIPRVVLVPLIDSYMKGAVLSIDAYAHGGWSVVDTLYKDPPESTEQVLHPEERLLAKRDRPHRVTLPSIDDYTIVASDVLGELQWSVYFSLWKHEGDGHEEQNWGGDRYAVLRSGSGKLVALIATTWDTEYDAKIFYDAYVSTLKTRYPGASAETEADQVLLSRGDESTWVVLIGQRVFAVDGGNDDELIDTLIDGTKFD